MEQNQNPINVPNTPGSQPQHAQPPILEQHAVVMPLDTSLQPEYSIGPEASKASAAYPAPAAATTALAQNFSTQNTSGIPLERVQAIILQRKNGALTGMIIGFVVLVGFYLFENISIPALVIFAAIFFPIFLGLLALNTANYPNPKPSYRTWNKVLYLYGSQLALITSIFRMAGDMKQTLNPMLGFKQSDPSRSRLFGDIALEAGSDYVFYKNMKRSEIVEAYYQQLPPRT